MYILHDVYNLAHTGEIFLREEGATELQGTHPISLHKSFLEMPLLSWFLLKEFEFTNAKNLGSYSMIEIVCFISGTRNPDMPTQFPATRFNLN